MHRIHGGLTVVVPVNKGSANDLRNQLELLNGIPSGGQLGFNASDTTLFVTGVILPNDYYCGKKLEESFVFATSFWGPLSHHLHDLVATNLVSLCSMFQYCEDFSGGLLATGDYVIKYIKKHSCSGNYSSRYNFVTKKDVKNEKGLRNLIGEYIDKAQTLGAFVNRKPAQIKWLIQRHVRNSGENYAWALKPFKLNVKERLALSVAQILKIGAAPIRLLVFLILGFLVWIFSRKNMSAERPPDSKVRQIAATQLNPVVNSMTAAAPLKSGRLRKWVYAFVLQVTGSYANMTTRIPTVSSIRWLSVNGNRRLLFISNYSNTTDFYVRDFLNGNTPTGVNFMFTNGQGFPDAKLLLFGGIRDDPEGYMNAVRTGQLPNELWYAHEKNLTIDGIERNSLIRRGLPVSMNDEKAGAWLRLL